MEFGLLEMDGPTFGLIGSLAIWYMIAGAVIMFYLFISLRKRFGRLRKRLRSLVEPILDCIKKGEWGPSASSFVDAKDPQLPLYAAVLRQELSGKGPLSIIEALDKTTDLLDRRLNLKIYYLRLLGGSICFVGFIGALSHTLMAFRAAHYLKDVPVGALAGMAAEATSLFLAALFIGLVSLAGSYFSENRLSHLSLELSDRILKAAEERTAQDFQIGRV
jgi:hypothetical protein